jgi:hypothetical protein
MAGFAQVPPVHDSRLGFLALKPACLKENFAPFFRCPFPDWFALAYFSPLASTSISLRENFVWSVHMPPTATLRVIPDIAIRLSTLHRPSVL